MASAIKKVNMITQIVRLRQVVRRWKAKSLTRHPPAAAVGSNRRPTPSGSLAVYVGPDRLRFVIPTRFLNLPVFVALLRQAEEEFGFQSSGGLVLPCDPAFFTEMLRFLHRDEDRFRSAGLDEFLNVVSSSDQFSCKETTSSHAFAPLLPV
ncbi:protein SMALL AUXIN UP-REGULATED RNA 51-like [Andrographis paniculata]|uniref:protein SMALL AUXIN UP-REGULATED RNA 51-like n=1 Tax=Andrographis paniculata TaxID=175694 RepID=UPI0021E759C4|nr:protein SMALL AUXIN UP-REGULATED RNA 51-like [Andrographis paniculata]